MVLGDNKGHDYEKKIVKILKEKQLLPVGTAGAGSGPGSDIVFSYNGTECRIEIKSNVIGPDYGQKRLIPKKVDGAWKWDWAQSVKELKITKYYTKQGVLDYLNGKKIIPNKYRKDNSKLTLKDVKGDQKTFEDRSHKIPNEAFIIFYEDKADYVQVGNGYGLFHLRHDKAKLGTEQFHGEFILRFRAKRHTTKDFHSYSFFATLACKKIHKRSQFNLENYPNQEFPFA